MNHTRASSRESAGAHLYERKKGHLMNLSIYIDMGWVNNVRWLMARGFLMRSTRLYQVPDVH